MIPRSLFFAPKPLYKRQIIWYNILSYTVDICAFPEADLFLVLPDKKRGMMKRFLTGLILGILFVGSLVIILLTSRPEDLNMRLDKYLTSAGVSTRSATAKAVRAGEITVDGSVVRDAGMQVVPGKSVVILRGEEVLWRENVYILLNKPEGYVSATEDGRAPVVNDLLDKRDAARVFPCGRLDKYTVGLMLLTDDGEMSHRLLAPARHVAKTYFYRCREPLTDADAARLRAGVHIEGGYLTAPCGLKPETATSGRITLTEGKYHQIKQMFGAVGNEITGLERVTFGPLSLDPALARGQWRYLTEAEVAALKAAAGK